MGSTRSKRNQTESLRSAADGSTDAAARPVSRWQVLWPIALAALVVTASGRTRVAGPAIEHIDKITHFSVYGLLATLVCRLGQGWRGAGWALLVVSGFGATDEWHQSFIPGRSTEFADWVADTAGAMTAIAMYVGIGWYRRLLEYRLRWPGAKKSVHPATART